MIAVRVPSAARYPEVLGHGDDGEIEWLVLRRIPGRALAHAWPDLSACERAIAVGELASALRALHGVDARDLPGDGDYEPGPPHVLPLGPLLELVDEVARDDLVDAGLARELSAFVRARWDAFDDLNVGLVHGDPHLENVLWDGEHVSAVLDLEWARRSWLECDLEILLSVCDHPQRFVSAAHEARAHARDYAEVPGWLAQAYPELFAHPRLRDRLAILHISRTLTVIEECDAPQAISPIRLAHLEALLDGSSFLCAR